MNHNFYTFVLLLLLLLLVVVVAYFYRVYGVLVGKPEGKNPLGSSRRRWEDNIKVDLQEVG